jgi:hypothetical protein
MLAMAEQIRFGLTLDPAAKELLEASAQEFSNGKASAYVRGLICLHQMLLKRSTGAADIPGWMLAQFPLPLIAQLAEGVERYDRMAASPFQHLSRKPARKSKPAKK